MPKKFTEEFKHPEMPENGRLEVSPEAWAVGEMIQRLIDQMEKNRRAMLNGG